MAEFDPKKLQFLSPDADDWTDLVNNHDWLNQENGIYGVLLYPKKGISKEKLNAEAIDWIGSQHTFGTGDCGIIIKSRKSHWAVIYHIIAWYDHFDLPEVFD